MRKVIFAIVMGLMITPIVVSGVQRLVAIEEFTGVW